MKNFREEDKFKLPENKGTDLVDFLGDLWEKIFDEDQIQHIDLYNQGAKIYNDDVKFEALQLITDFKTQKTNQMATKKKAAKKAAPKKKAAAAKKGGDKAPSQKTRIVELAGKGKTIDQIVEITGIQKANVSWYFSKLKLGKK